MMAALYGRPRVGVLMSTLVVTAVAMESAALGLLQVGKAALAATTAENVAHASA